jgi:pimeloyl-ACP methyl ester carboxylesterase
LVERVRAMMTRQPVAGITSALRGMAARPDRTPLLAQIKCPTRVITGAADTLIPPSESEAMAAVIPGAQLVVIPDAGHLSNMEQAAAFNEAVKEFIRR